MQGVMRMALRSLAVGFTTERQWGAGLSQRHCRLTVCEPGFEGCSAGEGAGVMGVGWGSERGAGEVVHHELRGHPPCIYLVSSRALLEKQACLQFVFIPSLAILNDCQQDPTTCPKYPGHSQSGK